MARSVASQRFFTGEPRDGTGLTYLRARYYSSAFGRFLTRDAWEGDPNQPMSYNAWLYVYANPVNRTDPSGRCPDEDGDGACDPGWWCTRIREENARDRCLMSHCQPPLLPWRRDRDYDPRLDLIPNWNVPGIGSADQEQRQDRARRVWGWICEHGGPWGAGCPDNRWLAAWLLFHEQGDVLLADSVFEVNLPTSESVLQLVVQYLQADLEFQERVYALSLETSFFNPQLDNFFDRRDWAWLTSDPPGVAFSSLDRHWNEAGRRVFIGKKLIMWGAAEDWPAGVRPHHTMFADEDQDVPLVHYAIVDRP